MTDFAHLQMTPGVYLRKRREAAGLDSSNAPSGLSADLAAIEADDVAITLHDVNVLGDWGVEFDVGVLRCLVAGVEVRTCHGCGCSEYDPCIDDLSGDACHWASATLCSACQVKEAA